MFLEQKSIVIQVFRTDVRNRQQANTVIRNLLTTETVKRCTIDLKDCDKVLRAETTCELALDFIQNTVRALGFEIEELPE